MAKALRRLEKSLGPPPNEKLRRDAFNAANSIYQEMTYNSVLQHAACTLVCACWDGPNPNLIGNFSAALREGESLSSEEIDTILEHMINAIIDG